MTIKKTKIAIGVGTGLLAAGAAGYYFFASKDAEKNRKIVASWATKLKKDVEKEVKAIKSNKEPVVKKIIDKVSKAYKGLEGVNMKDVSAAVSELKKNWDKIVKAK